MNVTKAERRPARLAAYEARMAAMRAPAAATERGRLGRLWARIRAAAAAPWVNPVSGRIQASRAQGAHKRRLRNRARNERRAMRKMLAELRAARKAARS